MRLTAEDQTTLTRLAEQMSIELSEQQLLREIGLRARTFALYPSAASSMEKTVPQASALARAWDDLDEYGNWIFRRLHHQLRFALPSGGDGFGGAGAMVSILTATLDVAPAIASVVTALALKRASNPGWRETYLRPAPSMAMAR